METKVPTRLGGKIICDICGKGFKDIGMHVRLHGMKADDYRAMFGYGIGASLTLEDVQAKRVESGKRNKARTFVYSKNAFKRKRKNKKWDTEYDEDEINKLAEDI